jgi:hypothetical protein
MSSVKALFSHRLIVATFGQELAKVMDKILLVSEVASLAQEIQRSYETGMKMAITPAHDLEPSGLLDLYLAHDADDSVSRISRNPSKEVVLDRNSGNSFAASLNEEHKETLHLLLDEWEEPERQSNLAEVRVSHHVLVSK